MNVWTALILGLLAGWLIEWVIDWVYWRDRRAPLLADAAGASAERDRLRAELDVARRDASEATSLRDALGACRAEGQRLQTELTTAQSLAPQLRSELAQAQADLQAAQSEVGRLRAELAAEAPQSRAASFAAPAVLGSIPGGAYDTDLGDENARLRTELQSLRSAFASLRREQRDPLVDISGIGPVYERKLFDAGVATFDELAAMTPEQVRAAINPERWQEIDAEAWIAEAAVLAARRRPNALIAINGIGPVYERKLFNAGIYTFAQIATMTPDQIRAIIKPEPWQEIDPEAWIAEARERADDLKVRSASA